MAQSIRIKMHGKEENVALSGNMINKSSIKAAFLLSDDAVVKFSYESNSMQINCGMNEAGTSFLLPDGWSTMEFFAESDRAPSRPVTPMDISQSSAPVYVPIETDALVHQLEKYLFYEKIGDTKACFTVISTHYAVSFNHGPHQNWNSNSAENQTSVVIYNQEEQMFQTQLIMCNADMDFVVVRSEVPLVPVAPTICFPRKLERYILLGYPNVSSSYQALEGIFSSVQLDSKGRMRGSSGSQRGYSGGPIFNYKRELLGINVANESSTKFIGLSGQTTLNEAFNEVNAAFPSLSVIVLVYYLAMGIHESLNYQQ